MTAVPLRASRLAPFPERLELGPNILVNSDFSAGLTGWTVVGNDATHYVTATAAGARFVSDTLNPVLYLRQVLTPSSGGWYIEYELSEAPIPGVFRMEFVSVSELISEQSTAISGRIRRMMGYITAGATQQVQFLRGGAGVDVTIRRASVQRILNWT